MDGESLEPLLEKLCQGDMAVAKKVFLAYEPYLRKIIRRQLPQRLRPKFDSVDIVQSMWADLLDGYRAGAWHFPDVRRLQAFLVQVARNRFIDRFRQHRVMLEKEQHLEGLHTSEMPAAAEPAAPQVVEADELWEQMLALCPPQHREMLHLKKQGLAMDELVARTGLHPGSIRRILRNLARNLALAGDAAAPEKSA